MARILIVDDSRTTLEVVKVHLMSCGYEFDTAADATEGLSLIARRAPDLVISDLAMPGVTGLDLCKKLRESSRRRIPFVIVTSKKDDATKRAAFAAGVDGFLTKPIDSGRLQTLVSTLLGR